MKADDRNLLCRSGLNGTILFLSISICCWWVFLFFFFKYSAKSFNSLLNFFLSSNWDISHWYKKWGWGEPKTCFDFCCRRWICIEKIWEFFGKLALCWIIFLADDFGQGFSTFCALSSAFIIALMKGFEMWSAWHTKYFQAYLFSFLFLVLNWHIIVYMEGWDAELHSTIIIQQRRHRR